MDRHEERVLLMLLVAASLLILLINPETGLRGLANPSEETALTGAVIGSSGEMVAYLYHPIVIFFGILFLGFLVFEILVRPEFEVQPFQPAPLRRSFQSYPVAKESPSQKKTERKKSSSFEKNFSAETSLQKEWDWIHQELEHIKKL